MAVQKGSAVVCGLWQLANEEQVCFFFQYTSNICISPARISGSLVRYQQGPMPLVVRPGHELLVPPSQVAVRPLSLSRQYHQDCLPHSGGGRPGSSVRVLRIGCLQLKLIELGVEFFSCDIFEAHQLGLFLASLTPGRHKGLDTPGLGHGSYFRCSVHLSSVFDHGVRCTVTGFHLPPVRPGVFSPAFVKCLVTNSPSL